MDDDPGTYNFLVFYTHGDVENYTPSLEPPTTCPNPNLESLIMPPPDFFQHFSKHVANLAKLLSSLPSSLREGKKEGLIAATFNKITVPESNDEYWQVFNRRLDILFSEEQRDEKTGRLPNITRGPLGMGLVVEYLQKTVRLNPEGFPWSAAMPKVLRLVQELKELAGSSAPVAAVAPIVSGGKKHKRKSKATEDDDSEADKDYAPPKKAVVDDDDELPVSIFWVAKRHAKCHQSPSKKAKARKKAKKASSTADEPITLDSAEESDGNTAIKRVQDAAVKPKGARRGPANRSMQHFSDPLPIIDPLSKQMRWQFTCKHCPFIRTFPQTVGGPDAKFDNEKEIPNGFNNLATHLTKCKSFQKMKAGEEATENESAPPLNYKQTKEIMDKFLLEGKLNPAITPTQAGFRCIFTARILDNDLPWTMGESPMLANLFRYLKIKQLLPSDTAVRNELARLFTELHGKVVEELLNVKSKIAFATDTWTNKQMIYTFACSIASFINDEWKLVERIIDFRPLENKDHEGIYAARVFIDSARKAGIFKKITLAMDNASVNDVLFKTAIRGLLTLYDIPEHPDKQIRCLAHVINLVSQAILGSLKEDECIEDGDESDHFSLHKDDPIHYKLDDNIELQELEASREDDLANDNDMGTKMGNDEFERQLDAQEVESMTGRSSLQRRRQQWWRVSAAVYGGSKRVNEEDPNSPLLSTLLPVCDVKTRWNSTHGMVGRGLILREAINRWVFETPEYEDLGLKKSNWEELERIHEVLEPFTMATLQLSSSKCPTIPFVLPIYDALEKHLSAIIGNSQRYTFTVRTAVSIGKAKLLKYKSLAVQNHNYILGTALHPYLRAEWFRKTVPFNHNPPIRQEIVDQNLAVEHVQILVKLVAEKYQSEIASESSKATSASTQPPAHSLPNALSASSSLASLCDFDFELPSAMLSTTPTQQLDDELTRYFSFEGGRGELYDPLGWWKTHAPDGTIFMHKPWLMPQSIHA
ncbi:hypothetical protein H1R20_g16345, partial [Candolleomyces eurysporus]